MRKYTVPRTNPYTVPRTNPVSLKAGERLILDHKEYELEIENAENAAEKEMKDFFKLFG